MENSSYMQFNKVLNEPEDYNSLICNTVTVSVENSLHTLELRNII